MRTRCAGTAGGTRAARRAAAQLRDSAEALAWQRRGGASGRVRKRRTRLVHENQLFVVNLDHLRAVCARSAGA
jgi:plasmid stabilization system protein ParE